MLTVTSEVKVKQIKLLSLCIIEHAQLLAFLGYVVNATRLILWNRFLFHFSSLKLYLVICYFLLFYIRASILISYISNDNQ